MLALFSSGDRLASELEFWLMDLAFRLRNMQFS
jgi:hypothetical protein